MNRKRLINSPKKLRIIILVNVVLLCVLALAFGREYIGNIQIQREIAALEQEKLDLESLHLETAALIGELSSEYYLEKQAREKHGLAKDGETLILVKDDLAQPRTVHEVNGDQDTNVSNPLRWFYYFFSREQFDVLNQYAENQ